MRGYLNFRGVSNVARRIGLTAAKTGRSPLETRPRNIAATHLLPTRYETMGAAEISAIYPNADSGQNTASLGTNFDEPKDPVGRAT